MYYSIRWTKEYSRPSTGEFLSCMKVGDRKNEYTDAIIGEICKRWQDHRMLRALYLEPSTFQEFEVFRRKFLLAKQFKDTFSIVEIGLAPNTSKAQKRPQRPNLLYGPGFSTSFHQSLCLHFLATATRNVAGAIAKPDDIENDDGVALQAYDNMLYITDSLWAKDEVTGNCSFTPSLQVKIQCLEIWVFLYHFLLRKLFPITVLDEWINETDRNVTGYGQKRQCKKYRASFMYSLRRFLHPHDVLQAVFTQAWREDSTFDLGWDQRPIMMAEDDFSIPPALRPTSHCFRACYIPELGLTGALCGHGRSEEKRSWWDVCRDDLGSPFNRDFDWDGLKDWNREVDVDYLEACPDYQDPGLLAHSVYSDPSESERQEYESSSSESDGDSSDDMV